MTKALAPNLKPMRLVQDEKYFETGIDQLSALTFVSRHVGFIAVGDDKSEIYTVKPKRGEIDVTRIRKDDGELEGMEGACFHRKTRRLRVMSEDSRKIWELALDGGLAGEPEKIGKMEKPGGKKNKGYEGIEILPARLSPDKTEYQLAVSEGRPRRVVFMDPRTLEVRGLADVPGSLKDLMPDNSDLAVSPRGTLFLLSDEGNCFTEFAIRKIESGVGPRRAPARWKLVPLATTRIDTGNIDIGKKAERLQPEGLSFDHNGDLWIACEVKGIVIRFALQD